MILPTIFVYYTTLALTKKIVPDISETILVLFQLALSTALRITAVFTMFTTIFVD